MTDTDKFINDIRTIPLTIDEWNQQRAVLGDNRRYSYELGFATFYLNRTNRSGIIKGGVIGGVEQNGNWRYEHDHHTKRNSNTIVFLSQNKADQNTQMHLAIGGWMHVLIEMS